MKAKGLVCTNCGKVYPFEPHYYCPECGGVNGGILSIVYDDSAYELKDGEKLSETFQLMPVTRDEMGTLGTTATPLVRSRRLGEKLGLKNLWYKCESNNLSGSFKDRPITMGIAVAKNRFGMKTVLIPSSGNAAAACSAACANLDMEGIVLVPDSAPNEKIKQTAFCGTKVFKVEGPMHNAIKVAVDLSEKYGVMNVTSSYMNPFTQEGEKLIAYELVEQMGEAPDRVYIPCGGGALLAGMHRGFEEYRRIKGGKVTKMMVVQAEGCCPIVKADKNNTPCQSELAPHTVAGGICDGLGSTPKDGDYTLKACKESGGWGVAVSDEEILEAAKLAATMDGVFMEPSASAGLAAVIRDLKDGKLDPEENIIVVATGHGLKDMNSLGKLDAPMTVKSADEIGATLGL